MPKTTDKTIGGAVSALKEGKRVRRESFEKKVYLINVHGTFFQVTPQDDMEPMVMPFTFQNADIVAEDWEVRE